MCTEPLRTFSLHYRLKFGFTVGKIPLDVGLRCPNRNRGGCIFCDASSFRPHYLHSTGDIAAQIAAGKHHLLKNRFGHFFAYFQQETPTAAGSDKLLPLLATALEDSGCVGLIISTRPDYLDTYLLEQIASLVEFSKKECLIELGLQSVHDRSLTFLNRNHLFADFIDACKRLRCFDCFEVGAHLLFGIPGESEDDMLETVTTVCALGVDSLKLHHLQVVRKTQLEEFYRCGSWRPFTSDEYRSLLLKILPHIPAEVVLHRLWATTHPYLLVAPRWNMLATQLSSELRREMQRRGIHQGMAVSGC